MSKLFKLIAAFFKFLYSLLDKYIITPNSKVIYTIDKKINKNNFKIEKLLNRPNMLLYISLGLAIIVFVLIDSKVINLVETEAEIITNQPIKVEYNTEAYVIEDLPETADITLIGRKSDLYLAKQLGQNEVVLDLTDYTPRDEPYRVKLTYNQTINTLNYKLDPNYIYVTIKKKVSSLKSITYDVINQDKLNEKYSVSVDTISTKRVTITATQNNLDKIDKVQALIDVENKTKAFHQTCEIKAYDADGNEVQCTIAPEKVNVTCHVDSYSKEVPVKPEFVGQLQDGYQMTNYKLSSSTVTIYGKRTDISDINYITCQVDISNLSGSTTLSGIALQGNDKINKMSQTTIDVTMFIEKK